MLSAGGYPVTFVWLRGAHRVLAYLFFATFLAHFAAVLYHWLIRRVGWLGDGWRGAEGEREESYLEIVIFSKFL